MELPSSLEDIFFVIVIVIPGYTAFYLFRWLSFLEEKWSDRDILYLSLMFSVVIYMLTGFVCKLTDYNQIKNIILNPNQGFILVLITISIGLVPGLVVRGWLTSHDIYPGDVWDIMFNIARDEEEDCWMLIYTSDGKEYKGKLNYYDAGEDPKKISIINPIQIIRDDDYFVKSEFDIGKEILFKDNDILRIVFFTEYE